MDTQDRSTPFTDDNTKAVPDSAGIWFYHATGLPVTVIKKDDGELYFQGGKNFEEEMKVSAFALIKEHNEQLSKYSFTKLRLSLEGPISINQFAYGVRGEPATGNRPPA